MEQLSKREHNFGRIMMICTALLWGLAGVCVKSIPWNSMSIMASRCFIGTLMLAANKKSFKLNITKINLAGAAMMSLTGVLYMMAIKLTTAATAIVLQYIAPILVLLYTIVFQRIKPKLSEVIIILAVFGGCVLSFADKLDGGHILGNILGLASGVTFAAQIIIFNNKKADSAEGMYLGNVLSFIFCLPFMFFDKALTFSPRIIMWVLILGIFQYGLANVCYTKGCQRVTKIEGALLLTLEPIFNPIPVAIICKERLGTLALAGFFVVIAAVAAYGTLPLIEEKRKARLHS